MPEPLIFEISRKGREGVSLPACDVPETPIPSDLRRAELSLPEVSEIDVVRHYVRLSQLNYAVDTGFYPLGSCTMKYNPKANDAAARLPGFCGAASAAGPFHRAGRPCRHALPPGDDRRDRRLSRGVPAAVRRRAWRAHRHPHHAQLPRATAARMDARGSSSLIPRTAQTRPPRPWRAWKWWRSPRTRGETSTSHA